MRVLVTGRHGQLAQSLAERAGAFPELELIRVGRPTIDLEMPGSVGAAIHQAAPDLVVNAAAYTAVDQAEVEPERAFRVNSDAAGEAASAAAEVSAPIIYISTDYVFDGMGSGSYAEDAATNPIGVYGRSKLGGEEQVRAANPGHLIVRTAWVYSPFGRNFVKTMLRLAGERDEVGVVSDQYGSPTSALDLADALLAVISGGRDQFGSNFGDTYHLAGQGRYSWSEFAAQIFELSARHGGPTAVVRPILTADYPTMARRPADSSLDSGKFERSFGIALPDPLDSLERVVVRALSNRQDSRVRTTS